MGTGEFMKPETFIAWFAVVQIVCRLASELLLALAKYCRGNDRLAWLGRLAWTVGILVGMVGFDTPERRDEAKAIEADSKRGR
jgi:hypothetical protein